MLATIRMTIRILLSSVAPEVFAWYLPPQDATGHLDGLSQCYPFAWGIHRTVCHTWSFDNYCGRECAQQLVLFFDGGRSIVGFRSKKPFGMSRNPVLTHGCTGKSSVRTG